MPALPQAPYSSAAQILSLVQDLCNDPQGQRFTTTYCFQAISSAVRWMARELRNRGKMTLVEDEYLVTIPEVIASDPTQQVNLTFTGINGNVTAANTPTLPDDMIEPIRLWERPAGSSGQPSQNLSPMQDMTGRGGLPKRIQGFRLTEWEWRTDMICFLGALQPAEVMIRYKSVPMAFSLTDDDPPQISGTLGDIDGVDCCSYYAASQLVPKRGGVALGAQYRQEAQTLLEQLATDVTLQQQMSPARMRPYGGNPRGWTRNL